MEILIFICIHSRKVLLWVFIFLPGSCIMVSLEPGLRPIEQRGRIWKRRRIREESCQTGLAKTWLSYGTEFFGLIATIISIHFANKFHPNGLYWNRNMFMAMLIFFNDIYSKVPEKKAFVRKSERIGLWRNVILLYIILCGLFFNIIDIYTHIKALRVRTIVDILNCYNFVNEIVRQSIWTRWTSFWVNCEKNIFLL